MRLPTNDLQKVLQTQVTVALAVASIVIAVGFAMSNLLARHITNPINRITQAASDIEDHTFAAASLDSVALRSDELGGLARTFRTMAHEVQTREEYLDTQVAKRTAQLEEKNQELEIARKRIDDELEIAQAMQQAILPATFPDHAHYSGFATMIPAREMGGDFYDFFPLGDDRFGVVIADVSGKGVPAAFFMGVARTTLRAVALRGLPPGECLEEANTKLCSTNPMELFVTVFYGILDSASSEFRYASGGHNPPLLIKSDGEVEFLPGTSGLALGIMEDMPYKDKTLKFGNGDTLFLYTDGITEVFDPEEVEFGETRLTACLKDTQLMSPQAQAVKILDTIEKFAAGAPQADDITCLVLRYGETGQEDTTHTPTKASSQHLEITLKNDLAEIAGLAEHIESFSEAHGLDGGVVFNFNLALEELITNTVSYGYDDDKVHMIKVTIALDSSEMRAEIEDDGHPFNPLEDAPEPDLDADIEDRPIGGLGTHLVKTFMDDVAYTRNNGHNRIVLKKTLLLAAPKEKDQ
ncbi:MAG: HAMP domain-containing protein [Sulfitobacter sp. SK025]|nr:MAG: HAMP domain-containing protein [Sulfitobacter sp. SK025]